MPVHDWTRVDDSIFLGFHLGWIVEIRKRLNLGLITQDYYALLERHWGRSIPEVMNFPPDPYALGWDRGKTRQPAPHHRGNLIAVRRAKGHRLRAILEIPTPEIKARRERVEEYVAKVTSALRHGVHVLVVDLFPPGDADAQGIHDAIWEELEGSPGPYGRPQQAPLTIASYVAGASMHAYVEPVAVGAALPDMPLFLSDDRYVNIPFEETYREAFAGMPAYWRNVLERQDPAAPAE